MNLANEKTVPQFQDVRQWAKDAIAEDQQLRRIDYAAKPFEDLRCPICGTFRCEGC
jgi:hypothetical protein